jgi:ABC-type sugar transport system substrate-binding protein
VVIIGIDGNPNAIDAVGKGDITATLGVNPGLIGSKAIETLDKAIKGKPSPKKVVTDTVVIDKANYKQFQK